MRHWDDLTYLEQLACTHWDMYKDAYGVRPRHIDVSKWTEQDFLHAFKELSEEMGREEQRQEERERFAAERFENQVNSWISKGTVSNREHAIEKFHVLEGTDGDLLYLCFCLGLSYHYFSKKVN
jgi:hypothetical protein